MPLKNPKTCTRCGEAKEAEEDFYRNSRAKGGRNTYCKECTRSILDDWKRRNPERVKEQQRRYIEKVKAENARGAQ